MGFDKFYYVLEAFQEKDMQKALSLIKSYLEKALGVTLYQKFGVDYFKNSKNSGEGIRYFLPNDSSIRFNFNNSEVVSVDIWKSDNKDPFVNFETKGISIVKILPFIAKELQIPQIGTFEVDLVEEKKQTTTEAIQVKIGDKTYKSQSAAIEDLLKAGKTTKEIVQLTNAQPPSVSIVKKKLGMMVDVKVFEAGKNEINTNPDIVKLEPTFDKIKYADPKYVYDDIAKLVKLVAERKAYSLLITGAAGTGKSTTVKDTLKTFGEEDVFFIHKQGVASSFGLYELLYKSNNKILVLDDFEDILKDSKSLTILKAALDNKKERKISWDSKSNLIFDPKGMSDEDVEAETLDGKTPNMFIYTGGCIFITNLPQDKLDEALKSRSYHIDVTLRSQDIIVRIKQIMNDIQPHINNELKEELLKFMETNQDKLKSKLDLRSFDKACTLIATNDPDWQRLVINNV